MPWLREQLSGEQLPSPSTSAEQWVQVLHRFAAVEKITPCDGRSQYPALSPGAHGRSPQEAQPASTRKLRPKALPQLACLQRTASQISHSRHQTDTCRIATRSWSSVESLVTERNVRYSRHNSNSRNLLENLSFRVFRGQPMLRVPSFRQSVARSPCRPDDLAAADLADAPGRALSAGIPGGAGQGRLVPRSLLHARACGRGNAAAVATVRFRCGDRVLRHSGRALCAWGRRSSSSRARARSSSRSKTGKAIAGLDRV